VQLLAQQAESMCFLGNGVNPSSPQTHGGGISPFNRTIKFLEVIMKFVGIDPHANRFACCRQDETGDSKELKTFELTGAGLADFFKIIDSDASVLIEAATTTFCIEGTVVRVYPNRGDDIEHDLCGAACAGDALFSAIGGGSVEIAVLRGEQEQEGTEESVHDKRGGRLFGLVGMAETGVQ
jgi:hypothetical protein